MMLEIMFISILSTNTMLSFFTDIERMQLINSFLDNIYKLSFDLNFLNL